MTSVVRPAGTTTVSVRDVREVALRALRASGLHRGEAEHLAEVITAAEIHEGIGLAALLAETRRIPASRVGLHREHGDGCTVVHDPAARGALQVFVPAGETAAVVGPVVVPGLTWDPVLDWAALDVAGRAGRPLVIGHTTADGGCAAVSLVTPDGTLSRFPAVPAPPVAGLTIRPWSGETAGTGHAVSTAAQRERRHRAAVTDGLTVDTPLWTTAYSISRGFLIPDHLAEEMASHD